jgi:hypothetical protein
MASPVRIALALGGVVRTSKEVLQSYLEWKQLMVESVELRDFGT